MLYETLNQPYLFFLFIIVGFFSGIVFDIGNYIKFLFGNKKVPSFFIDFLQTSIVLIILFFTNLKHNYGQFRLFVCVVFLFSFLLQRNTLGKVVAKFYLSCYNMLNKLINKPKKKNDETNKNG